MSHECTRFVEHTYPVSMWFVVVYKSPVPVVLTPPCWWWLSPLFSAPGGFLHPVAGAGGASLSRARALGVLHQRGRYHRLLADGGAWQGEGGGRGEGKIREKGREGSGSENDTPAELAS